MKQETKCGSCLYYQAEDDEEGTCRFYDLIMESEDFACSRYENGDKEK